MSQKPNRKAQDGRTGQALVEFALVVPVLVLMLFAAIEFGRAYYNVHLLTDASRQGARIGILPGKVNSDVEDAVDDFLNAVGLSGGWTTVIEVTDRDGVLRGDGSLTDAVEGDRVQVTVRHNFQVLTGRIIPGFSGTVTLNGRCVFRHE